MKRSLRFSIMVFLCLVFTTTLRGQPAETSKKKSATDEKKSEEPIDFERARQLLRKQQQGEKLTPAEDAFLEKAKAARRRGAGGGNPGAVTPRDKTGLKPLTEMTAD